MYALATQQPNRHFKCGDHNTMGDPPSFPMRVDTDCLIQHNERSVWQRPALSPGDTLTSNVVAKACCVLVTWCTVVPSVTHICSEKCERGVGMMWVGVCKCVPVGARLLKQHIVINLQVSLVVLRPSLQSPHIHHGLQVWIYNAVPCLTG